MSHLVLLAVPAGNSHDNVILFQLWLGHNSTSGIILHLRDVPVNSN
jgi:hypothetical protein